MRITATGKAQREEGSSPVEVAANRLGPYIKRYALHRSLRALAFGSLVVLLLLADAGSARVQAQAPSAYALVDQWPDRGASGTGILQEPVHLDVTGDGRVFISDPGLGGVHVMLPSGTFLPPIGADGQGAERLAAPGRIAIGPDPAPADPDAPVDRLYVLDSAGDRVAIFDQEGGYLQSWPEIAGAGIAVSEDGRVYVADREASQVQVRDAATGALRGVFGERGTEDGQFVGFLDLSIGPEGRVLAVADKDGQRVQLFDLATAEELAAPGTEPARLRRVYDLRSPRFSQNAGRDNELACRATVVSALGEDRVFLGEGVGACLIDADSWDFAIASSASQGTICKAEVRLPRLRPEIGQLVALGLYDPNLGPCGNKRSELETTPVVLRYGDEALRRVTDIWPAAANDEAGTSVLFSPESLALPAPDLLFVQDRSPDLRFLGLDGSPRALAARSGLQGAQIFETLTVHVATGSPVPGEIFGYYEKARRSRGRFQRSNRELGIGRFRTVERRQHGQTIRVLEEIWTRPWQSTTATIELVGLAYVPQTDEVIALVYERTFQRRTEDARIRRLSGDGFLLREWDLPDDGVNNPYVDLSVGPDGRVYALDDYEDHALVLAPDGQELARVPLAADARELAGGPPGPGGSVFSLRESGYVERLEDDGQVSARFDGRPLAVSDPTTLTDMLVDAEGRVYLSDGQTSLVSVFAPAGPDSLTVPDGPRCELAGRKSAAPARLRLGESVDISLEIEGRCGVGEPATDLMIVAPQMLRLERGVDPNAADLAELRRLISRIDFDRHRAGLVAYWNTPALESGLTSDGDELERAIRGITRIAIQQLNLRPSLKLGMEMAAEQLDDPTRRRVLLLFRPNYCNVAYEYYPGRCRGYAQADELAAELRAEGVRILAYQSRRDAHPLASSDEDIVEDFETAYHRSVAYRSPAFLGRDLELVDELPANMQLLPGSLSPPGREEPAAVRWTAPELGFGPSRFGLRVRPLQGGRHPTNLRAQARFTDGWGVARVLDFPVPEVEVIAPSPTPVEPTPTALPSGTPPPLSPAYLPAALRDAELAPAVGTAQP